MEHWLENDSTLLVLPTGGGKTVVFAQIAKLMGQGKVMVLAHREELIWQAKDKIERTTGLKCEVEMANWCIDTRSGDLFEEAQVIISTVQTQISGGENARMKKFKPEDFSALIVDESHHSVSKSYRKVLDHYRTNPDLRILGVTATPDRTDEIALGEIFGSVAFDYEILDAINDGWLVPIEQQMVTIVGLDFSKVRTTAGDLNGADLIAIMEAEETMQGVASSSLQIIGEKKAIVFTAGVKQAEIISEIFNRHKPGMSAWVCGETPKEERREILEKFAAGKIQVVANCGILTEGFDDPSVEVVIMARPTKSRSLYAQMAGRGTRALPGIVDAFDTAEERKLAIQGSAKPSLLIVDFVGNSGRHKLMSSADILGGKSSEEAIELAKEKAKASGKAGNVCKFLSDAEEELARKKQEEKDRQRQLEEARKARLVAQAEFTSKPVDPFEKYGVKFKPPSDWEQRHLPPLSDNQKNVIRKMGLNPDEMSIGSAKKLISGFFAVPSDAQKKTLLKFGYSTECTRIEAGKIIDELAKNGWRRPEVTA
jgi:superfamily II DNA or RNA helicase